MSASFTLQPAFLLIIPHAAAATAYTGGACVILFALWPAVCFVPFVPVILSCLPFHQVEEGLCQLMANLWLDSQDHWARQQSNAYQQRLLSYLGYQIRTDMSDVYGEGFRIALEKFQQRGLKALVEYVIKHGNWPDWGG